MIRGPVVPELGIMTRSINYYLEGRVFEWTMGLWMLLAGLDFLLWPVAIKDSAFYHLTALINEQMLSWTFLFIGWSRCSALMLNGQRIFSIKIGSYVRAGCSILAAIIWAQFVVSVMQASIVKGYPLPGITFWSVLTIGEIYVAYTTVKNG